MYTQEQLEAMSDSDLSRLVADKEEVKWHMSPNNHLNDSGIWVFSVSSIEGETVELPDYCNSWADMGPIIHENKISITFNPCIELALANHAAKHWDGCIHTNPLRAAAIVYLLME